MSSVAALGVLAAGLVLVVAGAELFFEGVLAAAGRLGVSAFALTVVVSGFELENLAAGIAADLKGLPDAAAGTFLGGTTFLALGVTGVAGGIAPLRARLPRAVLMWTAVSPLPLAALSLDGELSRVDGGLLLVWSAAALGGLVMAGRSLFDRDPPPRQRPFLVRVAAGLLLLSAGGEALGEGIRRVVERLGVSQTLLGNTVVAASVEAEEVTRVAVPARRGRPDIGLANVAGTIVHFTSFNAAVIGLVKPLRLGGASLWLHLPVATGSTVVLCVLLALRGGIGRPEGALLLLAYGGYLAAAIAAA
ncbi:MAG: sodium:calcium antiporter [Thermoleophilaceae bacterium]